MHRTTTVALAVLLTTATIGVAAVGAGASAAVPSDVQEQSNESDAYAGTHVAFEASSAALTNYSVGGDPVLEEMKVESKESYRTGADVGADVSLGAVTDLSGVGLELAARSETRAEIATEGSASMTAHDTERGILTVDAGGEGQYVQVSLSSDAEASAESDERVVLETDDGNRTGAFLVVGDGEVTVNEDGDVVADLGNESSLVLRTYGEGERDEDAREQESMIASGTASAEVSVEERDGERVSAVATYGQDIAVETANESAERVNMTVERTRSEGTVVITTVSEAVVEAAGSADDLSVTVDGEAAAEASSYGELEGAIGSDRSAYKVTQRSDASASADVLVAVNHFSERSVSIGPADEDGSDDGDANDSDDGTESGDADSDDGNGAGDGETDDSGTSDGSAGDDGADETPGFGVAAALIALLGGIAARVRR